MLFLNGRGCLFPCHKGVLVQALAWSFFGFTRPAMLWLIILGVFAYVSYRYLYAPEKTDESEALATATILPTIPPVEVPETRTLSPRDQVAGVVESLDWCNDITRICWPHIGKIVQEQLAPTIEPLINLYLPKPFSRFKFVSADLGKDPLKVDRVTVHRRFHNSIALDLDVSFVGAPNMSMRCAPLYAPFGVKELRWSGRLAILLRPLITTIPLVGAVQAAMITHPEMDMDFTGIAELADFGPIEKIVRKVLKDVIASMLVLPNRFLYKLSDSVDFFDVYYPPLGVLIATIEKGQGFTKEKKMGMIKQTPDLYCKATFGLEEMKTDVRMNNLTPKWGSSKSFVLSDMEQPFELKCYDKDTVTRDDLVGSFTMTAKELLELESGWLALREDIDERIAKHGQIFMKAQLFVFQNSTLPVRGQCMVSVLIDRATNLPESTKSVACKARIGNHAVRETPEIIKPDEPIPGVDPVNPIWSFSFDVLCDEVSQADVVLEVVENRRVLGRVTINAHELEGSSGHTNEGPFHIGNRAQLRAKIMLRGLEHDRLPV